ncbi:MAG: flagellar basal body P-ring formation protein FlgA [Bacteroidetes bacterium]|nr:flagellar basal body P-ring formation protein FlgA [Bacteroidota bacterium]
MRTYKNYAVGIILFLGGISAQAQSNFSGERLRNAVVSFAQKAAGNNAEILVSQNISDQVFQESDVTAKCTGSSQSLRGMSNVGIEFSMDGRIIRRIQIPVQVKIMQKVAVTTASISSNSPLSLRQITYEVRDVSAYSQDELITMSELDGSTTKRFLPKGSIITRSAIADKNGIRGGMPATILVQTGNVVIRTRGSVLNDASIGETVRVMREGTNTMLIGILRENQTVVINNSSTFTSENE